jgi:hypothetical protein
MKYQLDQIKGIKVICNRFLRPISSYLINGLTLVKVWNNFSLNKNLLRVINL